MKILQVLPNLGSGGAEHFTVELTNELVRQGYDCDILTLFDVEDDNDLIKSLNPKSGISSLGKKKGIDFKCYFRLYRFIKNNRYDVVHAHVGAIPYLLFAAALLFKKVNFFATIHSEAKRESGQYISKWNRFIMFKNSLCTPVSISEESKDSFVKYYNINPAMVYNGVSYYVRKNIVEIKDNPEQIVFVHPASCQIVKNQELLFRAFSRLLQEYKNVKLLWVGNNRSYMDLYKSLEEIMPKNAKYLGVVNNVRDYLVEADAMCLSSKMEGMPMTIIEAFSVGCPPLCTPVGGIVNLIQDGENGLLSKDLEVESYYNMLKAFCNLSNEERQMLRENAKHSFSKYSISNCAKGYLKLYMSKL